MTQHQPLFQVNSSINLNRTGGQDHYVYPFLTEFAEKLQQLADKVQQQTDEEGEAMTAALHEQLYKTNLLIKDLGWMTVMTRPNTNAMAEQRSNNPHIHALHRCYESLHKITHQGLSESVQQIQGMLFLLTEQAGELGAAVPEEQDTLQVPIARPVVDDSGDLQFHALLESHMAREIPEALPLDADEALSTSIPMAMPYAGPVVYINLQSQFEALSRHVNALADNFSDMLHAIKPIQKSLGAFLSFTPSSRAGIEKNTNMRGDYKSFRRYQERDSHDLFENLHFVLEEQQEYCNLEASIKQVTQLQLKAESLVPIVDNHDHQHELKDGITYLAMLISELKKELAFLQAKLAELSQLTHKNAAMQHLENAYEIDIRAIKQKISGLENTGKI